MSTKKGTKKGKLINLRITEEMSVWISKLQINVSDTCRVAIQNEIDFLRGPKFKTPKELKELKK